MKMKRFYIIATLIIGGILGAILFSSEPVSGQALQVLRTSQGGTGWGNITADTLLTGNGTGKLATTTIGTGLNLSGGVLSATGGATSTNPHMAAFYVATSTSGASHFPYASTTALTVSGTAYFAGSGIWNSSGNVGIGTASPS